jgi:hypothetical protein
MNRANHILVGVCPKLLLNTSLDFITHGRYDPLNDRTGSGSRHGSINLGMDQIKA